MDLLTLVSVCSFALEPAVMHSLIWHESRAEPWSFRAAEGGPTHAFPTLVEAIEAARIDLAEARSNDDLATIRVGLTALEVDLFAATAEPNEAMFAPCANITIASYRLADLMDRCIATGTYAENATYCAIAAYRGSWERPNTVFADAVMLSLALGDVPNLAIATIGDDASVNETTNQNELPIDLYETSAERISEPAIKQLFVPLGDVGSAAAGPADDDLFIPLTGSQQWD